MKHRGEYGMILTEWTAKQVDGMTTRPPYLYHPAPGEIRGAIRPYGVIVEEQLMVCSQVDAPPGNRPAINIPYTSEVHGRGVKGVWQGLGRRKESQPTAVCRTFSFNLTLDLRSWSS